MTMLALLLISLFVFTLTFALAEWLATGGSFRRPGRKRSADNELPWRQEW